MIANWTLSIISCYLACFAHRFSSYVAFFSRTSTRTFAKSEGASASRVDASGFRAATRPDRHRGCTCLSQDSLCYDDPFRKNKNFDFCATFLGLRTPFCPLRGGNGPLCVRFAAFSGFIRVLTPRGNPQSQKSCNFGRISVFGLPNRPHAGDVGGVSRAQRLCGRLWAAFAHFVSILFACRICGRSCPHPIAAPAALRYHDRNCFKRALKCILRSKQAGKGTQHNKEG